MSYKITDSFFYFASQKYSMLSHHSTAQRDKLLSFTFAQSVMLLTQLSRHWRYFYLLIFLSSSPCMPSSYSHFINTNFIPLCSETYCYIFAFHYSSAVAFNVAMISSITCAIIIFAMLVVHS